MFQLIYKCTNKIKDKVAALSAKLNEKGQGMVEYAIILAAVAIIAVFALWGEDGRGGLKESISNAFEKAQTEIDRANNEGTTPTTQGG